MNILILGSGGREHALADAYAKSKRVKKIFITPGNAFIEYANKKAVCFPNVLSTDFEKIFFLVKKYKIDLVDVAQDDPLALGFVDKFQKLGIKVFGPTKEAARIEWSKEWARNFMKKYNLPAPLFKSFNNDKKAILCIKSLKDQTVYIKASGLALGKGAIRADSKKEAVAAIIQMKQFGKAGETFLIEECLEGEEFSLFAVCDGDSFKILGSAQDHKTVFNNDLGPNTGGMGCVSNPKILTKKLRGEIEKNILAPFILGMKKEGKLYTGIIYLGGMLTRSASSGQAEVKIIEFNARWGDPEAEVLLPSIKTDYLAIVESAIDKNLSKMKIKLDNRVRISVAGVSIGYPIDYSRVKGKEIFGLEKANKIAGVSIYGAGIAKKGNKFVVNGGRVFHIVGEDKTLTFAREKTYRAISQIRIEGNSLHFRTDIGWRDLERNS